MFSITPTLTKGLLLGKNSEERYMTYYLGVPIVKKLFKSPLRVDKRETCSFYRTSKGELKYHDFGVGHDFNFVDVVMFTHKCTYHRALQIIANDFEIINQPKLQKNEAKIEYDGEVLEEKTPCNIQVEIKSFSQKELDWWISFGITPDLLKLGRVFSLKTVFMNSIPCFFSSENNPIYGYFLGHEDKRELWKIYFPMKHKYRFLLNTSKLQGLHMLPKTGDLLIINKSMKDVLTLRSLGYCAIAPQSENTYIKKEQFTALRKRFKQIMFWYDRDIPGKIALATLRKKFPAYYFFIPKIYKVKDISDFYKKYGREATEEFMDILMIQIEHGDFEYHITKYEKFRK